MVKSKSSATGSGTVRTSAGSYPKSMQKLIDASGHVSLNVDDYAGYSKEQIEAFFASRDYEVGWWTDGDGNLIHIGSDFDGKSVGTHLPTSKAVKLAKEGVTSIEDHHNHPLTKFASDGSIAIFSPSDIRFYVDNHMSYPIDDAGVPIYNWFTVHTQNGDRFSLRYHGHRSGNLSLDQFARDYYATMSAAIRRTQVSYDLGMFKNNMEGAENVSSVMDGWLRENSGNYGLDYESTWSKKGVW